jgi:hypothetical protein
MQLTNLPFSQDSDTCGSRSQLLPRPEADELHAAVNFILLSSFSPPNPRRLPYSKPRCHLPPVICNQPHSPSPWTSSRISSRGRKQMSIYVRRGRHNVPTLEWADARRPDSAAHPADPRDSSKPVSPVSWPSQSLPPSGNCFSSGIGWRGLAQLARLALMVNYNTIITNKE